MLSARLCLRGVLTAALFLVLTKPAPTQQLPLRAARTPVKAGSSFTARGCPASDADLPAPPYGPTVSGSLWGCETPALQPGSPPSEPCASDSTGTLRCTGDVGLQPTFEGLGKKGPSVLGARARVLDILKSENACTEWLRQRDPDPASTFRTLSFTVDSKAVDYVIARRESIGAEVIVNPYVATVMQDGGEFQTITLNAGGAFFRPSASLKIVATEGGPVSFRGVRTLRVGPYLGSTLQAQVTTLLHELGHVHGLLPLDTDDANGQSAANTREVLQHCQSEIESAGKRPSLSASR